jgi:hypothetical protein
MNPTIMNPAIRREIGRERLHDLLATAACERVASAGRRHSPRRPDPRLPKEA